MKEIAKKTLLGSLTGAIVNFIGGNLVSFMGKIPVPAGIENFVTSAVGPQIKDWVSKFVIGAGAQIVRRLYLEFFFNKDGSVVIPPAQSDKHPNPEESIWRVLLNAMLVGGMSEALGVPPYVKNGAELNTRATIGIDPDLRFLRTNAAVGVIAAF